MHNGIEGVDFIYKFHRDKLRAKRRRIHFKTICENCGEIRFVRVRTKRCKKCSGGVGSFLDQKGHKNLRWSGGRTKHSQGYALVRLKEHPRASSNGYVLEHIVIMEKRLGRFLLKGENVHHKNGIRDDNRIENLELWTRSQPTGQRVEDLISYYVSNYKDLILKELARSSMVKTLDLSASAEDVSTSKESGLNS